MSKERSAKRKTVRRIILIVLAAVVLLSAVIVGMCLFNERPAVRTLEEYRALFAGVTITEADGGVEISR